MKADDQPSAAVMAAERVLDQWLKALRVGGDPHKLSLDAVLSLTEAGAPPLMVQEVARLAAIASVDKKIKQGGWSEKQLALLHAARRMLNASAPSEEIMPLLEMLRDVSGGGKKSKGKKPRKHSYRVALAACAAAVTVLKKGQTVDAAVAEVATPIGISRKDLKNLRNRLNRGLVNDGTENVYQMMLVDFERMTRGEIMSVLSHMSERFCT